MYIDPNSRIILLQDVPIDHDQTDTLWFASESEQVSYFMSKKVKDFPRCTYNRPNRGYSRVDCNAAEIYGCNYMMFQNTSYGNKWFYAFINFIEYINDNVSEINFTIDPVQTWFFQYKAEDCFVVRNHTTIDTIGSNITPEMVDLGERVLNVSLETGQAINELIPDSTSFDELGYIVMVLYVDNQGYGGGSLNEKIFSGGKRLAFRMPADLAALNAFIAGTAEAPDSIIAMYIVPQYMTLASGGTEVTMVDGWDDFEVVEGVTVDSTIDGYKPQNMKCLTYPYNYLAIMNNQGDAMALRYEYFDDNVPQFHITGNISAPVSLSCFPIRYKNSEGDYIPERITITGFPQCSWTVDSFKAWLAQNSVPILIHAGAGAATMAITGMPPSAESVIGDVESILTQAYTASIAADITRGSFQNGSDDAAHARMNFKWARVSCRYEYIKRIDNFFTAFGYAIGETQTPNRHARSRFTYVQTLNANIGGNLPADDAQFIANCYNKGIRFWADKNNVGNYTTANVPLGG